MESLLKTILDNDLCSGCGLCAAISSDGRIKMKINSDGFARPFIQKSSCEDKKQGTDEKLLLSRTCPGLNLDIRAYKSKNYHPLWGEVQRMLRGHAADNKIRHKGSSGGVITALAVYCLENNIVDAVIQIRASGNSALVNEAVINRTASSVIDSCGSRYAPASPVEALKIIEKSNEKFLFIGKPCDVAAVRQLQEHNEELKNRIPFLISFMCAGTPSIVGTYEILKLMGIEKEMLADFRYRGHGWPGLTKATLTNGKEFTMPYNDSWGKVLNRHLQTRCKICPDGIGEFADIVCADGWEGDESGYPSFCERDGQSLILVRSDKGSSLINAALNSNIIKADECNINTLRTTQPFQFYRRTTIIPRLMAMKSIFLKTPSYKGFELSKGMFSINIMRSIRAYFGFIARRKKIKSKPLEIC